jgi:hypothetical protein
VWRVVKVGREGVVVKGYGDGNGSVGAAGWGN